MKHLLIMLLLILLASGLFAQKGMFGLAFGDIFAHSDSLMQQMGLSTKDKSGKTFTYYPDTESEYYGFLSRINLYLDKESGILTGWVGYFFYPDGRDVEAEMLAALTELHGKDYVYSTQSFYKNPNVYTWEFEDKHYAKIGDSGDVYYVTYDTHKEP